MPVGKSTVQKHAKIGSFTSKLTIDVNGCIFVISAFYAMVTCPGFILSWGAQRVDNKLTVNHKVNFGR